MNSIRNTSDLHYNMLATINNGVLVIDQPIELNTITIDDFYFKTISDWKEFIKTVSRDGLPYLVENWLTNTDWYLELKNDQLTYYFKKPINVIYDNVLEKITKLSVLVNYSFDNLNRYDGLNCDTLLHITGRVIDFD